MDTAETYYVKSYCCIKNNKIFLNDCVLYEDKNTEFSTFIKQANKHLKPKEPKFYKMDALSKLGFLASEVLLDSENLDLQNDNNIAIVFSNKSSSLDTDRKHQESIQNKKSYYPSPAVFVYTLPNICIGEISIKYKLYTENSFFIFDTFNADHLFNYSKSLLSTGKAEDVLCGWVEIDGNNYNAFVYLVSKQGKIKHNIKNIIRLYNNNMEELKQELKKNIIEQLNLEDFSVEDINDDDILFGDGLGLDSIDALELIVMLDRNYGIKISDPKEGRAIFESINTMATYIFEHRTK